MWIRLTTYKAHGETSELVDVNSNLVTHFTQHRAKDHTNVYFALTSGEKQKFIQVNETADEIRALVRNG